jgi:hypothetical protein
MNDLDKEELENFKQQQIQQRQENSFSTNLQLIQQAASELVGIQEAFNKDGKISNDLRRKYSQSLEKLGISAQKLANIEGNDDDLRLLLEGN